MALWRASGTSPDSNAALVREIKLVARPYVERLVPGIDISNDPVHAVLLRRVGGGDQLLPHFVLRHLRAHDLRIAEKESLIAGQPVQDGCRTARKRSVIGVKSDQN